MAGEEATTSSKTYLAEVPCKKCGSFLRYFSSPGCADCRRKAQIEYQNTGTGKAKKVAYQRSLAGKAARDRYNQSPKRKIVQKRQNDKATHKASQKRYEQSPHGKKKRRERYVEKTYGLSADLYWKMLKEQHTQCAICFVDLTKPYVDHDHTTGKVRGILCQHCNSAIGFLREDESLCSQIAAYLIKHKHVLNNN